MIDFTKSTALYGGSFDPIHMGHLHVVRSVLEKMPQIKQVVLVPAGLSPGKKAPIASAEDRLAWLLLVGKTEGFKVWGTELHREGPSFTVNTLREATSLGSKKDHLYFILGSDSYQNFHNWKAPEQIRAMCRLVVVARPGFPVQLQNPEDIILETPTHPASSSETRQQLSQGKFPEESLPRALLEEFKNLSLNSKNPYAIQDKDGN